MGCTVRELQSRIDAREFAEWMAYYQLEPWGRETQEIGRLLAMLFNRYRKERTAAVSEADMIPGIRPPEKKQTVDDMAKMLSLFAGVANG